MHWRVLFCSVVTWLCLTSPCWAAGKRSSTVTLHVVEKQIKINGQPYTMLAIEQPDGTLGLRGRRGCDFNVNLINKLEVPTCVHWHGLILPNEQDGVAFVTQFALYPGQQYHYQFPLRQSGTFYMHSHLSLQEQRLMTAPLILCGDSDDKVADQEAVVMLNDFTFKPPEEVYRQLQRKGDNRAATALARDGLSAQRSAADLVEVEYDAYLANLKSLDDPDIFTVKPCSKVRLRIINGSSATNFFIDIGKLNGEAIAVDGGRIKPLAGRVFELGIAQRIDIVVTIPSDEQGFYPIYAHAEGTNKRAGVILATAEAEPQEIVARTPWRAGDLTNKQELHLRSLNPLAKKPIEQHVTVELGGDMSNYKWTLDGRSWPEANPIVVKKGTRVALTFKNSTAMTHPMHLHGHFFQITAIDDKAIEEGALRDTILVMPKSSVTVEFDADNPGVWPLHCHLLYHLEAGMFTLLRYEGYQQPL